MQTKLKAALFAIGLACATAVSGNVAIAGDCTGFVIRVRPISQYDHYNGNGFLAVRTGPGSGYQQIGELYLGDEISVWDRRGNWYQVACMSGRCNNPLWGTPSPQGWVYRKYVSVGGVCP